jgi:hypothetical protein
MRGEVFTRQVLEAVVDVNGRLSTMALAKTTPLDWL